MEDLSFCQWLYGLLIDCPMGKPLESCPISKYRNVPATKKIHIAFNIPREELKNLILHHKKCIAEREASIKKFQLEKAGMKNLNSPIK